jgi:L-asparaginase
MKITFIQTGGTIDKDYPRTTRGYAFEIAEPAVKRIMEKLNPAFDFEIIPLLKKDSLEITGEDRQRIYDACASLDNGRIVITHGTDTMIETARKLAGIPGKTIVITGAMRPERFANSDAPINVGAAVGALSVLEHGVYIAMHGQVLAWDHVKREPGSGQFVPG